MGCLPLSTCTETCLNYSINVLDRDEIEKTLRDYPIKTKTHVNGLSSNANQYVERPVGALGSLARMN